jgi:hypothetical protein
VSAPDRISARLLQAGRRGARRRVREVASDLAQQVRELAPDFLVEERDDGILVRGRGALAAFRGTGSASADPRFVMLRSLISRR